MRPPACHRPLGYIAACALALGACDSLTVKPFSGTAIVLDIGGDTAPTGPGQHVELWARNRNDDIIRISYLIDQSQATQDEQYGLQIRYAIDPRDPCIISVDNGYLLTDPRAYPTSQTSGGVTQTPQQLAMQISSRIRNETSVALGGIQSASLLLAMPYDGTPWPTVAPTASGADRLAACNGYWGGGRYAYTPYPPEIAEPLHGVSLGSLNYITAVPSQNFSEITLASPFDLSNVREVWFTLESVAPKDVDPLHRGPVWLLSAPSADQGRVDLEFDLHGDNGLYGSIAFIIQQPPSAF